MKFFVVASRGRFWFKKEIGLYWGFLHDIICRLLERCLPLLVAGSYWVKLDSTKVLH